MDARALSIFAVLALGAGAAIARARPAAAAGGGAVDAQLPVADWLGSNGSSIDGATLPDNPWTLDLSGIDTSSGAIVDDGSGTNVIADYPSDQVNTQLPTFGDTFMATPLNMIAPGASPNVAAANERACLDMIAWSEGTAALGDNGYNIMFGGRTFDSYADHPRLRFPFTNGRGDHLTTSAAGRYQFLIATWDALARKLQLPDFGPASQDAAALELIREKGALGYVRAGNLNAAIPKIAPIWASLPGAGYAQPERKLDALLAKYRGAGGTLEA